MPDLPLSRVHVVTRRCPREAVVAMARSGAADVSWQRGGRILAGVGEAARITSRGENRFGEAVAAWQQLTADAVVEDDVSAPGSGLVALGSFAFSAHSDHASVLIVPAELWVADGDEAWFTIVTPLDVDARPAVTVAELTDELLTAGWYTDDGHAAVPPETIADGRAAAEELATLPAVVGRSPLMPPDQWRAAVSEAVRRIRAGELEKTVLARAVELRASASIPAAVLVNRLVDTYPDCWTYVVDGLVGATPEMLVKVSDGTVMSRVLAGTIPRGVTASDDDHRAHTLSASAKETQEHDFAVRSVAAALRGQAADIVVPEQPFVLELPNVMHLATDITGTAPAGVGSLDLAATLHPSAAVCGTPSTAAADVIDELEQLERGRYAGPVGWTDARGNGEWGIALRCGLIDPADPTRITLYAGCGIVAESDPDAEFAETEAKMRPMRQAMGLSD